MSDFIVRLLYMADNAFNAPAERKAMREAAARLGKMDERIRDLQIEKNAAYKEGYMRGRDSR